MGGLLRLAVLLVLGCVSAVFAQTQGTLTFLPTAGECSRPESVFCLQPSAIVRLGANRIGPFNNPADEPVPWVFGSAFGVQLAAKGDLRNPGDLEGITYKISSALWFDAIWNLDLLEAYAEIPLDSFRLSVGKRTRYSGPWDDVLMGRLGRWGVYVDASRRDALSTIPLGFEAAYLPNPGFVGGLIYLGVSYGVLYAGSFVDVVETPATSSEASGFNILLTSRVGLQSDWATLFWQQDRGFWSNLNLPIGQIAALIDPSSPTDSLDGFKLEALVWWNPDWDLLNSDTFIPPNDDRNLYFLTHPQKLLLGLSASWQDQLRIGVDVSRAPVEAIRVYAQFWLR